MTKEKQVRIYIPGIFAREVLELVEKAGGINSVEEIRDASSIPTKGKIEKVWYIEFEDFHIPPKFYAKKLPCRNIDEIVQFSIYPISGKSITTTQYLQSHLPRRFLEEFYGAPCNVRIYNGEHPVSSNYSQRLDGTIILADLFEENGLIKRLKKVLRKDSSYFPVIVTKENLLFESIKNERN